MKRVLAISLLMLISACTLTLSAQPLQKMRVGTFVEDGELVIREARTTLAVDLVIEVEEFVPGPYARYAERMLGCPAARLTSSAKYRIVSSSVSLTNDDYYAMANPQVQLLGEESEGEFAEFLPDRQSATRVDLERSASNAAERIFMLRAARLELITAELGDGVYGAGLESALREIDKIEGEYTDLFLGKSSVRRLSYRYYIPVEPVTYEVVGATPSEEASEQSESTQTSETRMKPQSLHVARFSEMHGVLPLTNYVGELIEVIIEPSDMVYPESNPKGKILYHYANNANVALCYGRETLVARILPIYEFGCTVRIALEK